MNTLRRLPPEVRRYLRDLDLALAPHPPLQTRELRQQIRTHLADALASKPSTTDVTAVLSRLGPPADLAAEMAAASRETRVRIGARRFVARVRHAGWPSWVLACLLLLALGYGAARLVDSLTEPPIQALQFGGSSGFYYNADYPHEVDTQAGGAMQSTVPIRSAKLQGIILSIYNPAHVTQTVVGIESADDPFGSDLHVLVSEPNPETDFVGGLVRNVPYGLPEPVPPHQYRQVLVNWDSNVCLARTAQVGIRRIQLSVRAGGSRTTETISLMQGYYVSGPSHGPCRSAR